MPDPIILDISPRPELGQVETAISIECEGVSMYYVLG